MTGELVPFPPNNPKTQVIAQKTVTVTFTIEPGTRPEMEDEIEFQLNHAEFDWKDSPEGINVIVISESGAWRPRKRFQERKT